MLERLRRRMVRQNRIYIMPSSRGVIFLTVVVVMILTAATYNNNLIFILAFFLFGLFAVTMLQTHYNLKGARLEYVGSDEAFEGDPLSLLFHITQTRARIKRKLEVRTSSKKFKILKVGRENLRPTDRFKPLRVEVLAWRRGIHALPEMILETYFPLGLFRAWKVFRLQGELMIYPKAAGDERLPQKQFEQGEEETGIRTTPDGDFGELKTYVAGESYHQIAWKHFARTRVLYTKVHWGAEHKHYEIPWNHNDRGSDARALEEYLRQMSRWVLTAVEEDATFEMDTPQIKIEPGRGREQARLCWRALAAIQVNGKAS